MLPAILFAISLSVDALGVGITYGIRKVKISVLGNGAIFLMIYCIMFLSISIGKLMGALLPEGVTKLVGAGVIILLGIWTILQGIKKEKPEKTDGAPWEKEKKLSEPKVFRLIIKSVGITVEIIRNPISCDLDKSQKIDPIEALYLGAALSLDSLGVGIAGAALGFSPLFMPALVALFQIIFIALGRFAGNKISSIHSGGKIWVLISGGILFLLGILRLV